MGNFGMLLPPKLLLRMSTLLFLVVHNANGQYGPEGGRRLKPCELESLLRDLTYPEEGYEMHAAALRNQLRHILERDPSDGANYQSMDEYGGYENSGPYEDKRSYRSLLRDGASFGQKRNLGSLARAGLLRAPPAGDYLKRSIATLAKNGQLPSREPDSEESSSGAATGGWTDADKRNVASAFRSGYMLNGKRNIASLARKYELPGKRNIQSLLRTGGMMPSIAPKRNMQALARDNSLPHYGVVGGGQESKRNIQTLVRDWNLPKQQGGGGSGAAGGASGVDEKRNIQSLKSSQGGRKKRELYYDEDPLGVDESGTPEVLEPVYQSAPLDYEELMEAMSEAYPYYVPGPDGNHIEEKRFLGSLARAGMLNRYHRFYHKRSGWTVADAYGGPNDYDDGNDDDDDDDDGDDDEDNDNDNRTSQKNDRYREEGDEEPDEVVTDDDPDDEDDVGVDGVYGPEPSPPRKRHIASIARSGWSPSFRPSRAAGRFSRSGRARSHIVEFYSQPERLRQPTAGVCRRCDTISSDSRTGLRSASTVPFFGSSSISSWGAPGLRSTWGSAPPRVTALHWRRFRGEPSTSSSSRAGVRRIARGLSDASAAAVLRIRRNHHQ
ncbi:uncharacterized protein LOC120417227 isoform X2 [Culex pipiens pallens]|uniref:uncharacterized protein LOC120417227 isoform X2 n=1 Tax=Culex pipiens pallens TaxID=42434 RepID=UPI001953637E|nr:uncharacterized protein LOC120417227 isoform X2 [Culex pipiens pallens]